MTHSTISFVPDIRFRWLTLITLLFVTRSDMSWADIAEPDKAEVKTTITLDNYDNDDQRLQLQAHINNPWGLDNQFVIDGVTAFSSAAEAKGLKWISPKIANKARLNIFWSSNKYLIGGDFTNFHYDGEEEKWGLGLSYPVMINATGMLNANLDLQRKNLKTQDAATDVDDRSHVNLISLSLDGYRADSAGVTSGSLSINRGVFRPDSEDAKLADQWGSHAGGHFWVGRLKLQRLQYLPDGFRLSALLQAQLASRNLSGSEKIYLGGPYAVMSYPVGEAGGDEGLMSQLRLAHDIPIPISGKLELALLGQYGKVWLDNALFAWSARPNYVSLAGAGIELRYSIADKLTAQLSHVHRLGNTEAQAGPDEPHQTWFGLTLSF